jgi:hypothetical protein
LHLHDDAVANLVYLHSGTDPNNPTMSNLNKGDSGILKTFIRYVFYRDEISNPIGDKWTSITQEDFDQFRCNLKYARQCATLACLRPAPLSPTASTPISATSLTSILSQSTPSAVDMFKRGIKCDPLGYPVLKNELWNNNWYHSFANQARAQDVSYVLDPTYLPITPADVDLFQEKKMYVYAILESKVEKAKGKAIIRSIKAHLMPKRHMLNCKSIMLSLPKHH